MSEKTIDSAMEKASRQVLEFKDTYGIYAYYNGKKSVEREDFKYVDLLDEYLDSDDEEEIRNSTFPREDVLKHLKQARESFGFDVDVDIPMWLGFRHYIPIDLSGGYDRKGAYAAAEFAIQEINADMDSKSYELVEVVSNVFVDHYCLNYLTLTAKKVGEVEARVTIQAIVRCHRNGNCLELEQWRFKPDA